MFLRSQIERINHDVTDTSDNVQVSTWIIMNSANYRSSWYESKCATCGNCEKCGWRAINLCDSYFEEL
jgi:hypothetical protein